VQSTPVIPPQAMKLVEGRIASLLGTHRPKRLGGGERSSSRSSREWSHGHRHRAPRATHGRETAQTIRRLHGADGVPGAREPTTSPANQRLRTMAGSWPETCCHSRSQKGSPTWGGRAFPVWARSRDKEHQWQPRWLDK